MAKNLHTPHWHGGAIKKFVHVDFSKPGRVTLVDRKHKRVSFTDAEARWLAFQVINAQARCGLGSLDSSVGYVVTTASPKIETLVRFVGKKAGRAPTKSTGS